MCEYPTYKYKSLTLYIQETFNNVTSFVKIMKDLPIPKKGKRKQFFPRKFCLCKLILCPNIRSLNAVTIWCIVCLVCRLTRKHIYLRKLQILY